MENGTPVVNVGDCIHFLTAKSKREDLQSNKFLGEFITDLQIMSEGNGSIDPLDKSTWNGNDLSKLQVGIWNYIGCKPSHQQLAENLVQMAGHLAKTNVNEARRSARCKNHCIFSQDFNMETVEILCKKRKREAEEATNDESDLTTQPKKKKKKRPRRAEGKFRLQHFINYFEQKQKHMTTAKESLGQQRTKSKSIYNQIRTNKYKSSTIEVEEKMKKFDASFAKAKNMNIASKNLIEVTAAMEGAVVLRHLNIKNNGKPYLLAELEYRQHPTK
jgi:hypothetical protein